MTHIGTEDMRLRVREAIRDMATLPNTQVYRANNGRTWNRQPAITVLLVEDDRTALSWQVQQRNAGGTANELVTYTPRMAVFLLEALAPNARELLQNVQETILEDFGPALTLRQAGVQYAGFGSIRDDDMGEPGGTERRAQATLSVRYTTARTGRAFVALEGYVLASELKRDGTLVAPLAITELPPGGIPQ